MMPCKAIGWSLAAFAAVVCCSSCQNYAYREEKINPDSNYFSIRLYADEQINLYAYAPFTLDRISSLNGVSDTAMTNFFQMDWASIFHAFDAADIGRPKFLGQYDCAVFDDPTTGDLDYTYTAKDPKLFTRLLHVSKDPTYNRITSLYIETAKSDFFGSTTQKLLYIPLRIIQIQEAQHNRIGKARNLRVVYRFAGEGDGTE